MQLLDEMRDTVGKEFDFVREARLMHVIRVRLQESHQGVCIPEPIFSLTTPDLLVMQQMPGDGCVVSFPKMLDCVCKRSLPFP